jgi:hypothetical protein
MWEVSMEGSHSIYKFIFKIFLLKIISLIFLLVYLEGLSPVTCSQSGTINAYGTYRKLIRYLGRVVSH